jgi:hypothetical protein
MASVSYRAKLLSSDLPASYHDSVAHSDRRIDRNNHNLVLGTTHRVLCLSAVKTVSCGKVVETRPTQPGILCEFDSLPFSPGHKLHHGSDAPDGLMIGRNPPKSGERHARTVITAISEARPPSEHVARWARNVACLRHGLPAIGSKQTDRWFPPEPTNPVEPDGDLLSDQLRHFSNELH